jgi:hypothetical protein
MAEIGASPPSDDAHYLTLALQLEQSNGAHLGYSTQKVDCCALQSQTHHHCSLSGIQSRSVSVPQAKASIVQVHSLHSLVEKWLTSPFKKDHKLPAAQKRAKVGRGGPSIKVYACILPSQQETIRRRFQNGVHTVGYLTNR